MKYEPLIPFTAIGSERTGNRKPGPRGTGSVGHSSHMTVEPIEALSETVYQLRLVMSSYRPESELPEPKELLYRNFCGIIYGPICRVLEELRIEHWRKGYDTKELDEIILWLRGESVP